MSVTAELGDARELQLSQGTIRYHDRGEGPPVVFVHGMLTNSVLFHKVVPRLAADARCITPDWPIGGHQLPMRPDADLSIPGLVRLVDDFLEAMGLEDVTLVGIALGGVVCQVLVVERPQRVGRLVLLPSDAYDNVPPPVLRYMHWVPYMPGGPWVLAQTMRSRANLKAPFAFGQSVKRMFEPEVLDAFRGPLVSSPEIRRDFAKVLRDLTPAHTRAVADRLGEFDRPVLVVWSREDRLFPFAHAERLAAAFPKARLEEVGDARSYMVQDQPERVADLLRDFVRG